MGQQERSTLVLFCMFRSNWRFANQNETLSARSHGETPKSVCLFSLLQLLACLLLWYTQRLPFVNCIADNTGINERKTFWHDDWQVQTKASQQSWRKKQIQRWAMTDIDLCVSVCPSVVPPHACGKIRWTAGRIVPVQLSITFFSWFNFEHSVTTTTPTTVQRFTDAIAS